MSADPRPPRRKPSIIGLAGVAVGLAMGLGVWFAHQLARERDRIEQAEAAVREQLDQARRQLLTSQLLKVASLVENDPGQARSLLHDTRFCPPDLRGFDWGLYERWCRRDLLTLRGHDGWVIAVAVSPDGRVLATADENPTVRLWDRATGKLLRVIGKPGEAPAAPADDEPVPLVELSFGDDGKALLVGVFAPQLGFAGRVCDTATGEPRGSNLVVQGGFTATLSSDARAVAVCKVGAGPVALIDPATGEETATAGDKEHEHKAVAFGSDGTLALATGDGMVRLWDLKQRKETTSWRAREGDWSPRQLALSPDGKALAASTPGGTLLWETATGKLRVETRGVTGAVSFTADGKLLGVAIEQGVALYETVDGKSRGVVRFPVAELPATEPGEAGPIPGLEGFAPRPAAVLTPDGEAVLAAASGGAKVWAIRGQRPALSLPLGGGRVRGAALSPDGREILVLQQSKDDSSEGTLSRYDAITGKRSERADLGTGHFLFRAGDTLLLTRAEPDLRSRERLVVTDAITGREVGRVPVSEEVRALALSPSGSTLALGTKDGHVRLWDLPTGREHASTRADDWEVASLAFSPDGKRLASVSTFDAGDDAVGAPHAVRLWTIGEKEARTLAEGRGDVSAAVFSPDGRGLAWSVEGDVRLWDVVRGRDLPALRANAPHALALAFSADGRLLLTTEISGGARLWDTATGEERLTLPGPVDGVTFAADGRRLLTYGIGQRDEAEVTMWETAGGPELLALPAHTGPIHDVAVTADGGTLVSVCAKDHTLRRWAMDTDRGLPVTRRPHDRLGPITPDGKTAVLIDPMSGKVSLWDVASGKVETDLPGKVSGDVTASVFSPDGRLLAVGTRDEVVVWETRTRKELTRIKGFKGDADLLTFAPDGRTLAIGWRTDTKPGGGLLLWDLVEDRPGPILDLARPRGLAFSPEGRYLAVRAARQITVWDWTAGNLLLRLPAAAGTVLAFSPDGTTLADALPDGAVHLRDAGTGEVRTTLEGFDDRVSVMRFTPDGRRLIVATQQGTLRLTNLRE